MTPEGDSHSPGCQPGRYQELPLRCGIQPESLSAHSTGPPGVSAFDTCLPAKPLPVCLSASLAPGMPPAWLPYWQLLERGPRKDPPWSHQVPRVSQVTAWLCYWPLCAPSRNRLAWGILTPWGLHQPFPLGDLVQEFFRKGQFPDESLPDCPTQQAPKTRFQKLSKVKGSGASVVGRGPVWRWPRWVRANLKA